MGEQEMKTTKIDWCDCTINPVIGCKNDCKYCYARRMNDRFGWIKDWTEPQFYPARLEQLKSKKPKSIFMDSMSDIGWWDEKWGMLTMNAISNNPQHSYIFLTKGECKYPSGLHAIWSIRDVWKLKNVFIGKTVDTQSKFNPFEHYDFLSIEPLLQPIDLSNIVYNFYIKQVIIGAETGNRKGKVIPEKKWVDDIVKQCDKADVRVFMKSSLKDIMGEDFRQDELIWENGK